MYIKLSNFGYTRSIKSLYCEGSYSCIERVHMFPELVYVIDGAVEITVDGTVETAHKGELAVITPFRAHSFNTPLYCKIWIGVISNELVSDFLSEDDIYINNAPAVFKPSRSLLEYVSEHLPPQYNEHKSLENDPVLYRNVKALTYAIFSEYTQALPSREGKLSFPALILTLKYISEHFRENITLKSVAQELGYTSTYLSHCIQFIHNMNFKKLVNSLRIDYAKSLLVSKKFKNIDIALECGFNSERQFYRAFFEIAKMTPREYKLSMLRKREVVRQR